MRSYDPLEVSASGTSDGLPFKVKESKYPSDFFKPINSFDLLRMLRAPWKSPNWTMNLVWMFVCQLSSVLVVGAMVAFGYLAEVAEARSGGKSEVWPDFNPERFGDYMERGLWPFLWTLIWTIPLLFMVLVPTMATIGLANMLDRGSNPIPAMIVAMTGIAATIAIGCLALIAMLASIMHAGLGNNFKKGSDSKWIAAYVSKMGFTTILVGVIYFVLSMVLNMVGLVLFCVGFLAVGPLLNLYAADVCAQLHDIFLSRGGVSAFELPAKNEHIIEAQVII